MESTKENQINNIIEQENGAKKTEILEGLKALLDKAILQNDKTQTFIESKIMSAQEWEYGNSKIPDYSKKKYQEQFKKKVDEKQAVIYSELYDNMSSLYNKKEDPNKLLNLVKIVKEKKEEIEQKKEEINTKANTIKRATREVVREIKIEREKVGRVSDFIDGFQKYSEQKIAQEIEQKIEQEENAKTRERLGEWKMLLDEAVHKSIEGQRVNGKPLELHTIKYKKPDEEAIYSDLYKKMSGLLEGDIKEIVALEKEDIKKQYEAVKNANNQSQFTEETLKRDIASHFINGFQKYYSSQKIQQAQEAPTSKNPSFVEKVKQEREQRIAQGKCMQK